MNAALKCLLRSKMVNSVVKLGIDIGGTKIAVGLVDRENRLIGVRKLYVSEITDPVGALSDSARALCADCGISPCDIISCGIGVPGTVSRDGRRLIKAPNLAMLPEDFADRMAHAFGVPTHMIQDSHAAAWGEYRCGAGIGASTLLCITLGTGIGTGIVIDGRIIHGGLGTAGELGHVPVTSGGRSCGCGKCGCVEKYAAGGGLDVTAQELFGEGASAVTLFDAASRGHAAAETAISDAVQMLGDVLVGAVNLLSPDCLLFSGGLSEQTEKYLYPLCEHIRTKCYTAGTLPRIEKAKLGELSPLIGAALIPHEQIETETFNHTVI